jgi:hypothetical protein
MSAADDIKLLIEEYADAAAKHEDEEHIRVPMHTAIDALQTERDSLLEALTRLFVMFRCGEFQPGDSPSVDIARAAIKASEGKAA